MKILVKWNTGPRNTAFFRMLLSTSTVEKLSNDMTGGEQWLPVNLGHGDKQIEQVRNHAIEALAFAHAKLIIPELPLGRTVATKAKLVHGPIGPIAGEVGLHIELGEVVFS